VYRAVRKQDLVKRRIQDSIAKRQQGGWGRVQLNFRTPGALKLRDIAGRYFIRKEEVEER